jgi:hypothetical protein
MTLDEIKKRENRLATAIDRMRQAEGALYEARAEYAEQEARKAGITYGKTLVRLRGTGPYFVMGCNKWILGNPNYELAKVKKDGTPSKARSNQWLARLSDMEIVVEAAE